jgi:hypothetical protein
VSECPFREIVVNLWSGLKLEVLKGWMWKCLCSKHLRCGAVLDMNCLLVGPITNEVDIDIKMFETWFVVEVGDSKGDVRSSCHCYIEELANGLYGRLLQSSSMHSILTSCSMMVGLLFIQWHGSRECVHIGKGRVSWPLCCG